jgi:hypothetical protein
LGRRGLIVWEVLEIVQGHLFLWSRGGLFYVFLKLGEVVKQVHLVKLAGMNEAHEQIADPGPMQGAVK